MRQPETRNIRGTLSRILFGCCATLPVVEVAAFQLLDYFGWGPLVPRATGVPPHFDVAVSIAVDDRQGDGRDVFATGKSVDRVSHGARLTFEIIKRKDTTKPAHEERFVVMLGAPGTRSDLVNVDAHLLTKYHPYDPVMLPHKVGTNAPAKSVSDPSVFPFKSEVNGQ